MCHKGLWRCINHRAKVGAGIGKESEGRLEARVEIEVVIR